MNSVNNNYDIDLFVHMISITRNIYWSSYDENLHRTSCSCDNPYYPTLLRSGNILEKLLAKEKHTSPIVVSNKIGLFWIADFSANANSPFFLHLLGPVFIQDIPAKTITNTIHNTTLGQMSLKDQKILTDFCLSLPIIPITHFMEYGIMMHYCLTREEITYAAFDYMSFGNDDASFSENEEIISQDAHASWKIEQQLLSMIEEGNIDFLNEALRIGGNVNLSNLGNGNHMRQLKNITIINTALCTRAAIRGGVPIEIAYTLSDRYIQQIEKSCNLEDIYTANISMQEDFVNRVHHIKINSEISPQIQRCCALIQRDYAKPIFLKDLANELGYSSTYLSRLFNKEMGISIAAFINSTRIEEAKKLLHATGESIQQIALTTGFSSSSYFIDKFKEATGMTPNEYRRSKS